MVRGNEFSNSGLQLAHAAMNAATELFVGQFGEPALDQVEPRPVRRREVDVKTRSLREPILDHWSLVRPVIVHDQMHVEVRR